MKVVREKWAERKRVELRMGAGGVFEERGGVRPGWLCRGRG